MSGLSNTGSSHATWEITDKLQAKRLGRLPWEKVSKRDGVIGVNERRNVEALFDTEMGRA